MNCHGNLSSCTFDFMIVQVIFFSFLLVQISAQLATVCGPKIEGYNATRFPCSRPVKITSRVTISKSPGAGGAPSPCETVANVLVNPCKLQPSPLVFEDCVQYKMEFLQRFRWLIYCPRFNWFYDPKISTGESICNVFKQLFSGIDVTIFSPDTPEPICSTVKNYEDLRGFMMMNANDCDGIKAENFLLTSRRVAYGLNLVSGCGQMRTVILSKALDEFPVGYGYRLVKNPCRMPEYCKKSNSTQ